MGAVVTAGGRGYEAGGDGLARVDRTFCLDARYACTCFYFYGVAVLRVEAIVLVMVAASYYEGGGDGH